MVSGLFYLDELWVVLVYTVDHSASRRVEGISSLQISQLSVF